MTSRMTRPFAALLMVLGVSLGAAACSGAPQGKSTDQATNMEQKPKAPQDVLGAP